MARVQAAFGIPHMLLQSLLRPSGRNGWGPVWSASLARCSQGQMPVSCSKCDAMPVRHVSTTTSCSDAGASSSSSSSHATPEAGEPTASRAASTAKQQPTGLWPHLQLSPGVSQALGLHAGSLWQRHRSKAYALAGVGSVWLVWRTACLAASPFVPVWHTSTSLTLLALSMGVVGAGAQYLRWHWGLNPATVYRQAMLRLNTSPAVLEVMGAPLLGADVRAYIVTGGHVYLAHHGGSVRPKISSRQLQMIFPVRGAEREGLVSLQVKKKQGQHIFQLLAVDVQPGLAGALIGHIPGARLYLEGNDDLYANGGSLDQLRAPFLKALQAQPAQDRADEAEDAAAAALARTHPRPSSLARLQQLVDRLTSRLLGSQQQQQQPVGHAATAAAGAAGSEREGTPGPAAAPASR